MWFILFIHASIHSPHLALAATSSLTAEDAQAYYDLPTWAPNSLDRLNFLLEEDDWSNLRNEFNGMDTDGDGTIEWSEAQSSWSDFTDEENINSFIEYCDDHSDEGACDFISFVFARGSYDKSGNEFDENEYDFRQAIFTESIDALIVGASEEDLAVLGIRLDEEGNIVDEL